MDVQKLQGLKLHMNWHAAPAAVQQFAPELPADYRAVIDAIGAGEGFIGREFVRLFQPSELEQLNEAYEIPVYVPGLYLIGSNGGGEAYCYDRRVPTHAVVRVPFVPLSHELLEVLGDNLPSVLDAFAHGPRDANGQFPPVPSPENNGMEITERHPVIFGGDPTDPKNKLVVDRATHIKLVRFWNAKYREAERQV